MAVNRYIIDTSAYSHFFRGDERFKHIFVSNNQLFLPLIVAGELRAGFALGTKVKENERLLQMFLDSPNVQTVSLSNQTTNIYADVFRNLKQSGRPMGTNDMWIAALALEHGIPLATADGDFADVKSLKLAKASA